MLSSPLPPFKLERYFARWEFAAPYLLCTSDIQGMPMRDLLALANPETRSLWENLSLGYTETAGHPLLREEIARMYEKVDPAEVFCFAGAEEAIYIAQRVLLKPGDHMIVTFPGYQSSYSVAEAMGVEVSRWTLIPETDSQGKITWKADVSELRRLLRRETRLVLVNFPHNPTGALPTLAEWAEMVAIVRDAGCWLFSDEVYRFLEYSTTDRLPAAADLYEKAISLGVMSKPFGLAGLRIGWTACRDHELLAQAAAYKDYTTICSSAPAEILAIIALRAKETLLARSLGIIQSNLTRVEQTMTELNEFFDWIPPQAGSTCFPRWRGDMPVELFTDRLVQSAGVLLLPATVYDYPGNHFRLGLGRENFPEALDRLRNFLHGTKH